MFMKSLEDKYIVTASDEPSCFSYRSHIYETISSYDKAEALAKKNAHRYQEDYLIFKACASVEPVVPEMKVTKLVK